MRAPTGTVLRTGIALVASLAALAACSGGDDPQPGTIGSPRPATTTAARTPTTAAAQIEAAVRNYYAELTRAAQTQEVNDLAEMSTKGCSCYSIVQGIRRAKRQGLTSPNATWTVTELKVRDVRRSSASAEVRYRVSAYQVLNSRGEVQRDYQPQVGHVDLSLVRAADGSRWIIGNLFDLEG